MPRSVRRPLLAAAFAVSLAAAGLTEAAEQVIVDKAQKAVVVLKTGQRHAGILYSLTSEKVRFRIEAGGGAPDRTVAWDAAEVQAVQLAGGTYTYDEGKKTFTHAAPPPAAPARPGGLFKPSGGYFPPPNKTPPTAAEQAEAIRREAERAVADKLRKEAWEAKKAKGAADDKAEDAKRKADHQAAAAVIRDSAPVLFGGFHLLNQTAVSERTVKNPTGLVKNPLLRDGYDVVGGGERVVRDEWLRRHAEAEAVVENPFDRPVELAVTLSFELQGYVPGRERTFKEAGTAVVLPPRSRHTVRIPCDALIGQTERFGKQEDEIGRVTSVVPVRVEVRVK